MVKGKTEMDRQRVNVWHIALSCAVGVAIPFILLVLAGQGAHVDALAVRLFRIAYPFPPDVPQGPMETDASYEKRCHDDFVAYAELLFRKEPKVKAAVRTIVTGMLASLASLLTLVLLTLLQKTYADDRHRRGQCGHAIEEPPEPKYKEQTNSTPESATKEPERERG